MIDFRIEHFTFVFANTLVHWILDPQGYDQPETEQYLHCLVMPHIQTQINTHLMSLVGLLQCGIGRMGQTLLHDILANEITK